MATTKPLGQVDLASAVSVFTGTRTTTPHQHAPQVGAPAYDLDPEVLAALDAVPRTGPLCEGCGSPKCHPWGFIVSGEWSCLVCPSKWAPGCHGQHCGSCGKAVSAAGTFDEPRTTVQVSGGRALRCASCYRDEHPSRGGDDDGSSYYEAP